MQIIILYRELIRRLINLEFLLKNREALLSQAKEGKTNSDLLLIQEKVLLIHDKVLLIHDCRVKNSKLKI